MRAPKKTNVSKTDSETTVVSENVVLGAKEGNTPAALVVDQNGFIDIEKLAQKETTEQDSEKDSTKIAEPRLGFFSRLLSLLRRPENLLLQRYYNSAVRNKLLNRFDWYRDFECEVQLTNKLGNLYGTNSPLSHFFKNNILASLIIIGVSFQLFVNYLSGPVQNRYAEKEQALNEIVAQATLEPDYSHVLNHCAVTDGLRGLYGGMHNRNVQNEVIAEIERFIKVYNSSDIEQWYADQDNKRGIVISQVQSILPRIQRYREQIAAEIYDTNQHHSQIKSKLDTITTSSSQRLRDINKSIKLRDELTEIESHINTGPNPKTLGELDAQLERIRLVITGNDLLDRPVSNWARDTSEQDQAALINSVRDTIDRDIDANIAQVSLGTSEAKQYRLRTLTATLGHFGDLIGRLQNSPNYFEMNVSNRQSLINGRLRALFEQGEQTRDELLSYDNCLTALNSTKTKLTVH